jgi:hypothetical protein
MQQATFTALQHLLITLFGRLSSKVERLTASKLMISLGFYSQIFSTTVFVVLLLSSQEPEGFRSAFAPQLL